MMIGLYREYRELKHETLSHDLARHLLTQVERGKVAIVTNRPVVTMSALRKQWIKIIRQFERERSSILPGSREEIEIELERLRGISFTAVSPLEDPQADVNLGTAQDFLKAPPTCRTLYIVCAVEKHEQYMLASWMPPRGLVVIYEQ
jgi:hypothetical protein